MHFSSLSEFSNKSQQIGNKFLNVVTTKYGMVAVLKFLTEIETIFIFIIRGSFFEIPICSSNLCNRMNAIEQVVNVAQKMDKIVYIYTRT